MKIVAFIGSPRENGNTAKLVNTICKEAESNGHEIEIYNLSAISNNGCIACNACQLNMVRGCAIDDIISRIFSKMQIVDLIILGTPIYFEQVSGLTKNFIDRMRMFLDYNTKTSMLAEKYSKYHSW
ncbi:flavodoxin family protein [Pectinatus haikarae]|uniref:flavodoxin family protein n=1 Tax=Pectinatus haikarae TaxID=349096 RepID=UPI0018C51390|nr:flavodoxin family protein [Pectinatus haikarae]